MKSSFLLLLGLIFSSFLLFLHLSALKHFMYWSTPWFDVFVHCIAGVSVAFLFLSLFSVLSSRKHYSGLRVFSITCFATLLVSIGWEFFEFSNGLALNQWLGYWPDTISDISSGVLGASVCSVCVIFFLRKTYE
jgi:hypothetical protein